MSNFGLTPVRTARAIASVIALMGMLVLLIQRVLSAVLIVAGDGLSLGLARYNNFTGRFAAQNFAEDKKLLGLLKDVLGILPMADTALIILMVLAVVLLVIAVLGLAFPKQYVHVLVALKILKWETGEPEQDCFQGIKVLKAIGEIPLKKLAVPVCVVLAIVFACVGMSMCSQKMKSASAESAVDEMQQKALAYIDAQKSFFGKKKAIGDASALQMADSLSTDAFDIQVSSNRFSAVSKVQLADCPAGSRWQVASSTKGFFSVELQLYRSLPKDTNCVKLTPNFKNLGRKTN